MKKKNRMLIYFLSLMTAVIMLFNVNAYGQKSSSTVTDIDGNAYHTVTIGIQVWMVENLKTTKYRDGTNIPNVTNNTACATLSTPGYCLYKNDPTNKNTYGALYNWHTVSTGKLCPTGWHVPTDDEWKVLTDYLGGLYIAGGKLKETGTGHWTIPNTGATNASGFSALQGGDRVYSDGTFDGIGDYGCWWSAEQFAGPLAIQRFLFNNSSNVLRGSSFKTYGFSVRCVNG